MPIVSWRPVSIASRSLVPTPSVPDDQHRALVAGGQLHQRAEAADAGQHFAALGAAHQRFDAFYEFVAGVDVDARIAVGDAVTFCHEPCAVPGRRGAGARMILYLSLRAVAYPIQTMTRPVLKVTYGKAARARDSS